MEKTSADLSLEVKEGEAPEETKELVEKQEHYLHLSSSKLATLLDEKDIEINQAIANIEKLEQEKTQLRYRRIAIEDGVRKGKFLKEKLKIERTLLSSAFWHVKNQGL